MSGHSKWSTIKRKKGAIDAKRGKIFTKLIKEITVSIKMGGSPDPESNPRLRMAIQNAKGENMPKENVERAIKKASGEDQRNYTEPTFEGYGPAGVAIFVETSTDNNNRTVSNVRAAFSKYGGSLGTNGSLEFLFDRKGIFTIKASNVKDREELELSLIDGGAEEIEYDEEGMLTVVTAMEDFGKMQYALDELGLEYENAELRRVPHTKVTLSDEDLLKVMKLIEALEDDDDVTKVYHTLELKEGQEELV